MPDYAGAVAAIKTRLEDNWTTTPIAHQNEAAPETPWPPVDGDGKPTAWVYLEIIGNGSDQRAFGIPGSQLWLYRGHILVHVFVPIQDGSATAHTHAVAIGEIFRSAAFYRDEVAGAEVWTSGPWTDGGAIDPDQGNWFRVTCTIPFEFYYRG